MRPVLSEPILMKREETLNCRGSKIILSKRRKKFPTVRKTSIHAEITVVSSNRRHIEILSRVHYSPVHFTS